MHMEASASAGGRHWLRSSDGSTQRRRCWRRASSPQRNLTHNFYLCVFEVTSWLASDVVRKSECFICDLRKAQEGAELGQQRAP